MKRWIAVGVVGLVVIAIVVTVLKRSDPAAPEGEVGTVRATPSGLDPLVEEFRATERNALHRFNTALREQRQGSMDELELSNVIERDVLTPWRELRARVVAAPVHDALYSTLRRYLELRQLSWEAYVTALRAPSDEVARPHYAVHRENNAAAHEQAKQLGQMFREAAERAAK